MSEQTPYQTLGLSEEATFEDIQAMKARLLQEHEGDTKLLDQVEAAYDAIIMERLRLRQEGKISVPETIRFPERQAETSSPFFNLPQPSVPDWLANWIEIEVPSRDELLLPTGVFAGLAVFCWLTPDPSIRSLLLVFGAFANIFFLNRKTGKVPRAILLSLGALLLGIGLGNGLVFLLQSFGVVLPVGAEQIETTMTLFLLWLISSFVI